ncbi:MAG: S1C family serine protease [Vulcanimicrobiaceae bacterium]
MTYRMRVLFGVACLSALLSACAPRYSDDRMVAAVRALEPSVVMLAMRLPPEHHGDAYDLAYASGTVIASGAWGSDILTVQHAVNGAWHMYVTIGNKRKVPGKVIALDAKRDIALVRVAQPDLPIAHLGSTSGLSLQIGRSVALMGYPIPDELAGRLSASLVAGTLSAVHKNAMEISLPIVPGESGGPVFLADTGEIIGVVEARLTDEPSIGFALPIDEAKRFLHRYDAAHGF